MNKKVLVAIAFVATLLGTGAVSFGKQPFYNTKAGAVYAMTNAPDDNRVIVFDRAADGMLTYADSVSTGGAGSGGGLDALGSQGSLALTPDDKWLLAANAGSNEISVFRVLPDGLELTDKVNSGGDFPVSLAAFHDLVYVLNAGASANVSGFYLNHRGKLTALWRSTRLLGSGGFAQVGFDKFGRNLVVTDRGENEILVYSIDFQGLPSEDPVTSMSVGNVPFGFLFDQWNDLLVSEAGSGAVSSYAINRDGTLRGISPSVANNQAATCWIAGNGRGYIYTANTGSQTISSYRLEPGNHGYGKGRPELVLLDEAAGIGNRPIDMDIAGNGRYLYALDPGSGTIDMFSIKPNGSLTNLGTVSGNLAIFAQGIAAR